MNFNEYQSEAIRTMSHNDPGRTVRENASCWGLGLAGEAGEVADYLKKVYYHGHPMDRDVLVKEMGDVLWYLAAVAEQHSIDLRHVAATNIAKLRQRYPSGFSSEASINREAPS